MFAHICVVEPKTVEIPKATVFGWLKLSFVRQIYNSFLFSTFDEFRRFTVEIYNTRKL